MTLKLLLGLLFIVWRSMVAEEYINHWLAADAAAVEFCSHDSFMNGSCVCNTDYSGNFCLQRKCRNFGFNLNNGIDGNGFLGVADRCICPPGFLGRNCEPVSCVNENNQIYTTSKNERTISLLASYNSHMQESWKGGAIGDLVCGYEKYNKNFNYNFDNFGISINADETAANCKTKILNNLDPDTCQDEDGNVVPCQQLNIDNLNTLVQNSPPNSIVFVVTNMKLPDNQINGPQQESIIATAIARKIQINVVVYNNTLPLLYASDPSLNYLRTIAAATLGTFVLPSVDASNEQYKVVSTLLSNWDSGIGISTVYTDGLTLPVDQTSDLYVAAETFYGEDLIFNTDTPLVVAKTDFWKLYKLTAGNFPPILKISNMLTNTKALVYSANRLKAYSAFTSDPTGSISIVDAAYSVSVTGAAYYLVLRIESGNTVLQLSDLNKPIGTPASLFLGSLFVKRDCQFNIALESKCTNVGPSVVTMVTNDLRSVSFPVYCSSANYGKSIYNNAIREVVSLPHIDKRQSISKDYTCANEIPYEQSGKRSFVIIAENSKDLTNDTKSSVDNVFRNKNSIFYKLTKYAKANPTQYQNFYAALNIGSVFTFQQSTSYDIFLTKIMNATNPTNVNVHSDSRNVTVTSLLTNVVSQAQPYSDILFVVNYHVLVKEDSTSIKKALAQKRSRLYVLFVQTYTNTTSDEYRYLNDVAVASGGVALRLTDYTQLSQFIAYYYDYLVDNDIVAKAYSENPKPGIALTNVYLTADKYYLLVTNDDQMDGGPVNATISVDNIACTPLLNLAELQLFQLTPSKADLYNIPIRFVGLAQTANAVLFASSSSQDFISLSFLDKNNLNRNDVEYAGGQFLPFFYSSSPFNQGSNLTVTYSDAVNPAKPVYTGTINPTTDCGFQNYVNFTNYPWVCSISGGLYHFKIDRVSDSGTITRTFPVTCLGPSSGECLNNGRKSNTGCDCPIQWTGSHCQLPVCLNGGTITPADTCDCLPPFSGDFCETSYAVCATPPAFPDYRSDLSSLFIVADAQALSFGGLTSGLAITGVPITTIIYGDGNAPRVVQSTTNGQHLSEVLGAPATPVTPAPGTPDAMYDAINLALKTQFTKRAFIVVYTSNPDAEVNTDILIRLAAKRAEIRVISTAATTPSNNYLTLALVGNGIPTFAQNPTDFATYLQKYVAPIFNNLQYSKSDSTPQKVFNVVQTGAYSDAMTITIPPVSTFNSASAIAIVQVSNGRVDGGTDGVLVGSTNYYQRPYDMKVGLTIQITSFNPGSSGLYSLESLSYLKTDYAFNINNINGAYENVTSGLVSTETNTIHLYSAPYNELPTADPSNFPYLTIREITSNGTLTNSSTVLFSRKSDTGCFFKHFAVLDVCSQSSTIGYQVQLTSRTSTLENRQQQFVLTCHRSAYQNGETSCFSDGSPSKDETCKCDNGYTGIDCEQKVCMNGGTSDVDICRCPFPYAGKRCELNVDNTPTTTAGPTIETTTVPQTTTIAPEKKRVTAFILDVVGSDDYAFNETLKTISEYSAAFSETQYIMLLANWNSSFYFGFQNYTPDSLVQRLNLFFQPRNQQANNKIASLSSALKTIKTSYQDKSSILENPESMNIFYMTQVGLEADDDPTTITGLGGFAKSSLVYSQFSKNAPTTIIDSLKKFSPTVTNVRDYYNGVTTMVTETAKNDGAVLPVKPNRICAYGLQSNIYVVIDRTSTTDQVNTNAMAFYQNFRQPFNFIPNDEPRCSSDLPSFYKERSAVTAFAYYDKVAKATSFCPSQYEYYLNFTVLGTGQPQFATTMKFIGKYINQNSCSCNRYNDSNTAKFVIWMPRTPAEITDDYRGYLKLNTQNAYHFVVPFYEVNKATDLFYQILVDQAPDNADFYLLPNAATVADVSTILAALYPKLCQAAGLDPTAIPPQLEDINYESRYSYRDYFF